MTASSNSIALVGFIDPTSRQLADEIRNDKQLLSGCMAGAMEIDELAATIAAAGFTEVRIEPKDDSKEFIRDWAPGQNVQDYVVSATIEAVKPAL